MPMRAVIMAGGFGTRLRPLTINLPKPMVPVGNLPMMEHVVGLLARHGITDVTALLYFQAETVKEHFKDGRAFGVTMNYAQPGEDYGTAGSVRYALDSFSEPVVVISGDLITDFDLTAAIAWHRDKRAEATILLSRLENPLAYGIVITDQHGRIVRFLEKPSWGEAFSDTINTGIYILEPSAIELIPSRTSFDFSRDLYPLMLSGNRDLYGRVTPGYWRDVGNVDEYRRVHVDLFDGTLELDLKAERMQTEDGVAYLRPGVHLAEDVELSGQVILGNDVSIGSGARLHNCAIGDRTRIGARCGLKNSVIWKDCHVGAETTINSSVVGSRARLGRNVELLDDVIVSDECAVGDSATVKANCKIWPGKVVDPGAIVSTSMVWGEKWNRELFTDSKITGLALTEITPEMAVRIGAAFGAFLLQGNSVVTSRDASDISRLLKRGLISGLLAAGVHVSDLETLPIPVVRYALQRGDHASGIYVRHSPEDFRLIDFIFFDGSGLDVPTAKLKKVERMYFGEDFPRASLDTIGHLEMPQRVLENYQLDFLRAIDVGIIKEAGFKVVIDHSNGASSQIFPTLFTELGISAVELNATLNPRKFSGSPEETAQAVVQLSSIVTSLNADIGFLLNTAAEKLTVVDDQGKPIDSQLLLLLVTDLFLSTRRVPKIAVPVEASMGVEEIAKECGVEVERVANSHLAMMEVRRRGDVDFVGGTRGGFIFPGFQMAADAMLTAVKVLEMMAVTKSRLSALRTRFETLDRQSVSVPCPWAKKGTVMRKLITDSENKRRQLIDGVRILEDSGWVLVAPDRLTAAFNIFVETRSREETDRLINHYRDLVAVSQNG